MAKKTSKDVSPIVIPPAVEDVPEGAAGEGALDAPAGAAKMTTNQLSDHACFALCYAMMCVDPKGRRAHLFQKGVEELDRRMAERRTKQAAQNTPNEDSDHSE